MAIWGTNVYWSMDIPPSFLLSLFVCDRRWFSELFRNWEISGEKSTKRRFEERITYAVAFIFNTHEMIARLVDSISGWPYKNESKSGGGSVSLEMVNYISGYYMWFSIGIKSLDWRYCNSFSSFANNSIRGHNQLGQHGMRGLPLQNRYIERSTCRKITGSQRHTIFQYKSSADNMTSMVFNIL